MTAEITRATAYERLPDVMVPIEVAAYLGLNVKTVREYIACGRIRAARMGKYYHIRKEWIMDYLEDASEIASN